MNCYPPGKESHGRSQSRYIFARSLAYLVIGYLGNSEWVPRARPAVFSVARENNKINDTRPDPRNTGIQPRYGLAVRCCLWDKRGHDAS